MGGLKPLRELQALCPASPLNCLLLTGGHPAEVADVSAYLHLNCMCPD